MKNFNKFLSTLLVLCSFSTTSVTIFAISEEQSKEHLSTNNFNSLFKDEITFETVLKYFLGPKAQMSDYWANAIKNALLDYCGLRKNFAFNDELLDDGIAPDTKFDRLLYKNCSNDWWRCIINCDGSKASFWLHIDGAWEGFFKTILGISDKLEDNRYFENYEYFKSLSDEEKETINDVNKAYLKFKDADSITIDPHKMGYIPYSAGAISFKNRDALILIKQLASYINDNYKNSETGSIDFLADLNDIKAFSPYVFECSKPGAAATSCWFTEKLMPYKFDEKNPKDNYHGDIVLIHIKQHNNYTII